MRRFTLRSLLPMAVMLGIAIIVFRQDLVPAWLDPVPDVDLAQPDAWFIDWRLARLKSDAQACKRILHPPWIEAKIVPDMRANDGCGWDNGVHLMAAGGARLHVYPTTCELAAAIALWLVHEVQPRAQEMFGARIASMQHMGAYACRSIKGNPAWSGVRSEHARANALDVAGFSLSSGKQISVLRDWRKSGPEGRFLRIIHARACRYFRVAIGPDYNQAHRNHFHYDRGIYSQCK